MNRTTALFVAFGLGAWALDVVVDGVIIYQDSLVNGMLAPNEENLWHRLFEFCIFISFGVYAGTINAREKAAKEKQRQARAFADTVFNSMQDAISVLDAGDFRIIDVNSAFLAEQGLSKGDVLGKTCFEATHHRTAPCSSPQEPCPLHDTVRLGVSATYEHSHWNSRGEQSLKEVTTSPVKDSAGRVVQVVHVARDITGRKQTEERMSKLSMVVEQTADMVVITGKDGIIEYVNPAFENLTGYSRQEAVGQTPRILKSGKHPPQFYQELWKTILSGAIYRGVFVNKKKNGELYYDECTITPVIDGRGAITHFVATAKDVTEQKHAEQELRERAEKDHLTGVFNRGKFYEILARELERAQRYERPLSLIMLDIDHFKKVNDTHGHAVGDEVLKATAALMQAHIRETDILARIGGEEFSILAPETALERALSLAEKVRSTVADAEWPRCGKITISLGVTVLEGRLTIDELVKRSDRAMYQAKTAGRNRVEAFRETEHVA